MLRTAWGFIAVIDEPKRLIEDRVGSFAASRHCRDHRNSDQAGELLEIELLTVALGHVYHVQSDHHRQSELEQLSGEIEVALQVACVDDVDDHVHALLEQKVSSDDLLLRICGQAVDPGEIDDAEDAIVGPDRALFALDGYARPVADVLVRAGELVENGGLPRVGVAHQGDYYFLSIGFHTSSLTTAPVRLRPSPLRSCAARDCSL